MGKLHVNWLNLGLAILLPICAAKAMNYRDWHPGVFTGWTLFGFVLLAVGMFVVGGLLAMSVQHEVLWTTYVAFALGLTVGIGGLLFLQSVKIEWKDALMGLLTFGLIGGMIASIAVTRWERPQPQLPEEVPGDPPE